MKKTFKPLFTVDLTGCKTPRDIYVKYADAKVLAGLPITRQEYFAIIEDAEEYAKPVFLSIDIENCKPAIAKKKPNIFKRFWNWLTRKNK